VPDAILGAFLARQREEGMALARESDLLELLPLDGQGRRYIAAFSCTGLVTDSPGRPTESNQFAVGIAFDANYLRLAVPARVVTWLGPNHVFHPNIAPQASLICVGKLEPGTSLVDILYQVFEIVTWQKKTVREDDALNRAACEWARRNQERFPIDRRPLKWRARDGALANSALGGQ
jgi:hypothetical protein